MTAKHEKYQRLIDACKSLLPMPTAVVHPCDQSSLEGMREATRLGVIASILVGPRARIESLTSRADSLMTRLASCAVAAMVAKARRESLTVQG